ncbi:MAG TPA: phage baseplate assembly protein V [Blastocatellia bacterium]|nr:phage baseplate assembly protein V [Blastocatellia bacterium]
MSDLLARLIEKIEGRFYGKYRAVVVDNADPENRGRLRLRIPSVLGADVVSGWALPCLPFGGSSDQGFFFVPEIDATVWVEFETGNLDYPIWVGTFWGKPGGATEVPKPADEQSPPTRKIIRTLKGSCIEIEDKDGEEVFIIKYNDGDKTNTLTMNADGILVEDANENKITMDSSGIKAEDLSANKIAMDNNGIVIEDANHNRIEMTPAAINIFPNVACNLGSAAVNMVNNLPACLFTGAPHALDAKGHAKVLK